MRFRSPMHHLYTEQNLTPDVSRSLNLILLGNTCGMIFGIICNAGTSAMVGLATFLGASDFILGLITAIPQAFCVFQIPFSIYINKTGKRKIPMVSFGVPARFCWVLIGLMPLLFPNSPKTALYGLLGILVLTSALIAMPSVAWFSWFSDLAPAAIRSRWLSIKETVCSLSSFVMGLIFAALLDNIQGAVKYAVVFGIAGLIGMTDISLFSFVKEVPMQGDRSQKFGQTLKHVFRNDRFMKFTMLWTAWCFTSNLFSPYLTAYSMNEMGLNFTQIMIFGTMICSVATALAMPRWGILLTKVPSGKVMLISCLGTCFTPLFYLFSSPGNIWPTLLYNLIGALLWSGCNLCATHMQLEFSPPDTRPIYLAIFNCITALVGTTSGSLIGGAVLDGLNAVQFSFAGLDRYLFLFTVASILRLVATLVFTPMLMHAANHSVQD